MVRSASSRVSNHEAPAHPSRRGQAAAPQDEDRRTRNDGWLKTLLRWSPVSRAARRGWRSPQGTTNINVLLSDFQGTYLNRCHIKAAFHPLGPLLKHSPIGGAPPMRPRYTK